MTEAGRRADEGGGLTRGLVADLSPTRPRAAAGPWLALLCAAQLAGFCVLMRTVPFTPSWTMGATQTVVKAGLLGAGALILTALCLRSLDPARRDSWWVPIGIGAVVLAGLGAGLDWAPAAVAMPGKEGTLLAPRDGLRCLASALTLGLPLALGLFAAARRGAPTRPALTGALIGAAAGLWGGFVYAAQCPYVSVVYVVLWYGAAVTVGAVLGRLALPQRLRW